jgi:hypothetical protein
MSLEQDKFRAEDAKQLLDNKLFKDAFAAVDGYLNDVSLSCDPDNKEKAQRIIISKQLLSAVKREIERVVEDGDIAEVRIAELEKRKGILRFMR